MKQKNSEKDDLVPLDEQTIVSRRGKSLYDVFDLIVPQRPRVKNDHSKKYEERAGHRT